MNLLTRIVVILGAALLPPLGMQVFNDAALRDARRADLRAEAQREASEIAVHLDRMLDEVRTALAVAAQEDSWADSDFTSCTARLAALARALRFLSDLRLLSPDGQVQCVAGLRNPAMPASATAAPAVIGVDRSNPTQPMLTAAHRLPSGQLLRAELEQAWLRMQLATLGLPAGADLTVADRDGTVLAALPDNGRAGTTLPDAQRAQLAAMASGPVDRPAADAAVAGDRPWQPTAGGLYVSVGLSAARLNSAGDAAALRGYVLTAAGFLIGLALAALMIRGAIARPVHAILATTERWNSGDTAARVGLSKPRSEFGHIAKALNSLLDAVSAAQGRLRERLAELDAVYHAAPVGLGFIGHDRRYVTVNAALAEIDGIGIAAHRGLLARSLLADDTDRLDPSLDRALAGQRVAPVEVVGRARASAAAPSWLLVSFQPAVAPGGVVLGAIVAVQEVTQLRRAETALQDALQRANAALERRVAQRTTELEAEVRERETAQAQLQQAQKMEVVGQLTGGVAHDFNNLLTALIGNLELATMRAADRPDLLRPLQAAMRSAERGASLTQRMLAFSRRQYLRFQPVAVPALLDGMDDLLARTIGPRVTVRVLVPATLRPAYADPNQIELVILNLVVNARDAMPDGGVVTISAGEDRVSDPAGHIAGLRPGDYVRLAVSDTGTGMSPQVAARAFEPFFTTKPVGRGSGLGLSMVHGVAVQSGGAARIDSTEGKGTTITLWLPCAEYPV